MVLRRLVPGLALGAAALAFTHTLWGEELVDRMTFTEASWFDNPALTRHLRLLAKTHKLTAAPDRCIVLFIHDLENGPLDVAFIEKNAPKCPVVKEPVLDLFHMHVDRFNKEITTDAGHKDVFIPL